MDSFFIDYLRNLEEIHADIRNTITGVPQEALDWTPGPGINSLAVLVTHLTGAERYWLGDVVAGEPYGRDREAEFRVAGLTKDDLLAKLGEADRVCQAGNGEDVHPVAGGEAHLPQEWAPGDGWLGAVPCFKTHRLACRSHANHAPVVGRTAIESQYTLIHWFYH